MRKQPVAILPFDEEYCDYLHDETKNVGTAESISFPESECEISEILSYFNKIGVKVTIQGNRTGLTAAAVPYGGHIISISRMDKTLGMRIENGDVYIKVQPGLTLSSFRQMLALRDFDTSLWDNDSKAYYSEFKKMPTCYFPPDPTETSATLGGMAACNSSGAKTYFYGPTRKYISGLRIVLADGDVISIKRGESFANGRDFEIKTVSGRVIKGTLPLYTMPECKNAAGYYSEDNMDLIDMFIGSDGTMGVISQLELKLIKMPECIWGINCFFDSETKAIDFVEYIKAEKFEAVAIEYFDENSLNILRNHSRGEISIPAGYVCMIYIELHCENSNLAMDDIKKLSSLINNVGGKAEETWAARSITDRERLLELRHRVPESVNALIAERKHLEAKIVKLGSDMAVPDGNLSYIMKMYRSDLEANDLEYAIWGHIGNSHLHVNILPRSESEMALGKKIFLKWAKEITKIGGTVSAEHGSGKTKSNMLPILYGESGVKQMAALKRAFDPKCLLGTGNLFPPEYVTL